MAEVALSGIQKRFRAADHARDGGFTLGPVDLTLPDGQLTVLAGPSGCGKTTLLRLIAGLESPCSGSISIGGQPVDQVPPHDRDVAMVFQDHALYPHMTVYANLAFPLKMRKVAKPQVDARVREAADWLELDDLLGRRPDQLSGGQQQRVALGRAIIRRPRVSLLDEPLAHLDTQLRAEMRDLLVALQRRLGLTMLHVTHDQAEAAAMADRVVLLRRGQVEQEGTAGQLYREPSTRFVAGFFGSPPMNFLDGRLKKETEGWVFLTGSGVRVPLADGWREPFSEDGRQLVTLGIRPEHVALEVSAAGLEPAATGRVVSVQQYDGRRLIRIEMGGCPLTVRCETKAALMPGDSVGVAIPPERILLFDRHGDRIPGPAAKWSAG